jgi:hypothetical protein
MPRPGWREHPDRGAPFAVVATASVEVLTLIDSGALRLLALLGTHLLELVVVAMLCLGGSSLLSGAAISNRMLSILHR